MKIRINEVKDNLKKRGLEGRLKTIVGDPPFSYFGRFQVRKFDFLKTDCLNATGGTLGKNSVCGIP